jgi:hypothetical protein
VENIIRIRNKTTREDYQRYFEINSTKDSNGCWIFNGHKDKVGYGKVTAFGCCRHAHRIAAWAFGILDSLESSLDVLHLNICKSKACVNPCHLKTGTALDNTRDSIEAGTFMGHLNLPPANQNVGKTHCKDGHPFEEWNTYTKPDGRRVCRICNDRPNRDLLVPAGY